LEELEREILIRLALGSAKKIWLGRAKRPLGALLSGGSPDARSIGALQLRHRTIAAAQKGHQRFDTLAALSTAATCGVDAARLGGAGGRSGLFYLVVG
jgi:hypothetical protein